MLKPDEVDALYGIKELIFYKNGLVVKRASRFPINHFQPVPRRGVNEMSKKSKLRLTHIVANCEIKFVSMFTLTYGDFFIPYNGRELKRQTNVFLTSLRKRFDCRYIWFLEFTKKQRPHLHVISTIAPNAWDRIWLADRWAKITVEDYYQRIVNCIGDDCPELKQPIDYWIAKDEQAKVRKVHVHKKCWESIYKENGATRYCLKYAAKAEQKLVPPSFQNIGRFWGTSRDVTPKPLAKLEIGETMTEERVREIINQTFVGQFPLIPKYIFQDDAIEFFTSRGMKLTEIIGENGLQET